MKFRPQIQLRFRDEAQFLSIKNLALVSGLSVNEFVIQRLEQGGGTVDAAPKRGAASREVRRVRAPGETPVTNAGSSPAPATNSHDPKTCRVYKCGQCAATGGGK